MLTTVVLVLLLTAGAAPYTFTGGTERGSFICYCYPDVQCDDDTGACPGDVCGASGSFAWEYIACQSGNVAQSGGTADQTGSSGHGAGRCIDGDVTNVISQRSCCNPGRTGGELSWSIDLRGTFAISDVTIYIADIDRQTISGAQVYVSASRTPMDSGLCGVQSGSVQGSTTIRCDVMVGRYVTIRQPDMNMDEMVFCEVQVQGYQYYSCGWYDGDYRYGPGCVQNCHCEHQCDVITGACDGDCTSGWRKDNSACALTCTSGFWGVNCESDCNCASHNRACDNVNGLCDDDCDSGYSGFNCQTECDDRHWGSNCVHECHCDCDRITGECDGPCDPGYYGNRCQHECRDGTWGIGNESRCPNNCYCTVPCDKVDGRCDGPCVTGRHGNSCQNVCVDGTWGEHCLNTCNCYADEVCEKTGGSCDRCLDWFVGVRCDQELPRMADITPASTWLHNNVTVIFPTPHNADYYTVEHRTDGDWMMDATRYPHNTQQSQQMVHITVVFDIEYNIRIVPWKDDLDQPGEPSQVIEVLITCDQAPGWWGAKCEQPCRCLDDSEACDAATGHCRSGCDVRYIGEGCDIVKPSLKDSTVIFIEDKDVIIITITNNEYMTELVSEYLIQYKLLHEATFNAIKGKPISGRRRREVGEEDVVLEILFSDQSINSQYEFRITPLISSPEDNGVVGVPSDIILYNSGCLQYTSLPSCNHWCVCSNDPDTLCLLTCDYCYVCDSEPELPSGKNVNFEITHITSDSMKIQFIDAHSDLPLTLIFLTRLGDHSANISSLASNTDYTYNNLSPNTAYAIEVTAILEDGVLSKSWTLTATTLSLMESSDNILPVVVGCVVSGTGVVVLFIVIVILLKRRKARQSQEETPQVEQPNELYDYIDELKMKTSTEISDNGYMVPVAAPRADTVYLTPLATPSDGASESVETPGDGYESLDTYTRENNKLYENENEEYTTIEVAK